jgi:hypothetical protein
MTSVCDGLRGFIEELDKDYVRWYAKSVRRCYLLWGSLQLLAILAGFITAILAALSGEEWSSSAQRAALVVLPLMGSVAATALLQFRVYDLWRLREEGRLAFQRIVAEGRRRVAAASGEENCEQIYADLQARAMEVEEAQALKFFGLWRSNFVAGYSVRGREN